MALVLKPFISLECKIAEFTFLLSCLMGFAVELVTLKASTTFPSSPEVKVWFSNSYSSNTDAPLPSPAIANWCTQVVTTSDVWNMYSISDSICLYKHSSTYFFSNQMACASWEHIH